MAHKDSHTAVLDRMLDDLKTTVGSDAEMVDGRSDGSLVSSFRTSYCDERPESFVEIFRSSSRNEARSGSRAGSRSSSAPATSVEDGGQVRHTHHEYRTPDNKTHVVTEKYEYDTGDTSKTKHYQKKVMKSTYSTFNSMNAGSVDDPPVPAPQVSPPAPSDTKVISASQKVANKLVDALSSIGREGTHESTRDSGDSDSLKTDTLRSSTTITTDYSTLGRLRKNINELDSLIYSLEGSQTKQQAVEGQRIVEVKETVVPVKATEKVPPPAAAPISPASTTRSKKEVVFTTKQVKPEPVQAPVSPSQTSAKQTTTIVTTKKTTESHSSAASQPEVPVKEGSTTTAPQPRTSSLTNGTVTSTNTSTKYENEDFDDPKSGEVRRIVWRNRFEKTYEAQDSSHPPTMSIEEEARRRDTLQRHHHTSTSASTTSTLSSPPQRGPQSPRQPHLQCAVYWPGYAGAPHVSPGSQSWKEPIPMPTPPQLSPREPGVAYIYTYGGTDTTGKSGVQPLPPLNYVNVPSAQSVPPSEGAPSPTPSSQVQTQPIIYHYSYHYTIQPGQPLPEGAPPPPAGLVPGSQPALQVAPPSTHTGHHSHTTHRTHTTNTTHTGQPGQPGHPGHPVSPPEKPSQISPIDPPSQPGQPGQPGQPSSSVNYNIHSYTSRTVNRTDTTNVDHSGPHGPGGPGGPYGPGGPGGPYGPGNDPGYPRKPREPVGSDGPSSPDGPGQPGQPGHPGSISITINKTTTRTTHTGGYPGGPDGDTPPVTSTPYSSRGRSVSPEPRSPGSPQHVTYVTNVSRTSYSDSLERVRRPRNETLPFPNTSPIKSQDNGKIPRRVDDLMTSFSDSEDGPGLPSRSPRRGDDPADHEPLLPSNNQVAVRAEADAKAVAAAEAKAEPTKNKAGPPVYYPPGHDFHETMHTMTLKEGRRRGKAKWRMERSAGYKESSSHSESKGGMAMVPVCLPLCCGAACVVM